MIALFESSKQIDPILIGEELKKDGPIESIGGITTITNLTFGLPHFSNVAEYIKVVKDKSVVRNLIRTCNQITSEALAEEDDAEIILDHAEQMIFALAESPNAERFCPRSNRSPEHVLKNVTELANGESHALTGLQPAFAISTTRHPACSRPILSSSPRGLRWERPLFA